MTDRKAALEALDRIAKDWLCIDARAEDFATIRAALAQTDAEREECASELAEWWRRPWTGTEDEMRVRAMLGRAARLLRGTKMTGRLPLTRCPNCQAPCDDVTSVYGRQMPESGSLSVCAYCIALLRFDDAMQLVLLTPDEIAGLDDDTRNLLIRIRRALAADQRPWRQKKP